MAAQSIFAFEGIIPPMVTPFGPDGSIDESGVRAEVRYMINVGVDGLTVGGSTGEGNTLSADESCQLARFALKEAGDRIPIISGIISDSTDDVIRRGLALKAIGVNALQVTPPHYLFSSGEQGILAFYKAIIEGVGLPVVIYNVVPWNTISVPTLLKLARLEGIVAVKQSGGDIHKLADLLLACKSERTSLRVLTAVDALLYPSFMLGAHGAVAGVLAVVPELGRELWKACKIGDHSRALALHDRLLPIWRVLEPPDFPARAKAALEMIGRPRGNPRAPLLPVDQTVRAQLASVLRSAEVNVLASEAAIH